MNLQYYGGYRDVAADGFNRMNRPHYGHGENLPLHPVRNHSPSSRSSSADGFISASTEPALGHYDHPRGHGGGGHPMEHMMKMYFHSDTGDTILFKSWVLNSLWDTLLTCVVFLLLALLYEGLKSYREHLLKRASRGTCYPISVINAPPSSGPLPRNEKSVYQKMMSGQHLLQSLLHISQVALSYTLMLGFMTFNLWLCLSILVGAGMGYFLFCWRKITIVNVTEHCH